MEADCKDRMVSWKKSKQGDLSPENSQPAQAIGTHTHTHHRGGRVDCFIYAFGDLWEKSTTHEVQRRILKCSKPIWEEGCIPDISVLRGG